MSYTARVFEDQKLKIGDTVISIARQLRGSKFVVSIETPSDTPIHIERNGIFHQLGKFTGNMELPVDTGFVHA